MYKRECMSSNYTSQKYRAHLKAMLQVLKEGVPMIFKERKLGDEGKRLIM